MTPAVVLKFVEWTWTTLYTKCHQQLQYKNLGIDLQQPTACSLNSGHDVSDNWTPFYTKLNLLTTPSPSRLQMFMTTCSFRSQSIVSSCLWDVSSFGKFWLPLLHYNSIPVLPHKIEAACHSTWQPSVQQVVDWPAFLHCVGKNNKITKVILYIQ